MHVTDKPRYLQCINTVSRLKMIAGMIADTGDVIKEFLDDDDCITYVDDTMSNISRLATIIEEKAKSYTDRDSTEPETSPDIIVGCGLAEGDYMPCSGCPARGSSEECVKEREYGGYTITTFFDTLETGDD